MKDLGTQIAYWDTVGATKTFTHPLHVPWLTGVNRTARVLDYGCGYGRVMAELSEHGFSDVSGVDLSPALIARGRRLRPDLRFSVLKSPPGLPCAPESFDVVLLFAVLTCIPDDDAQRTLATEVNRLLTPGGLLYVSDMVLQDDERIPAPATLPHQAALRVRHRGPRACRRPPGQVGGHLDRARFRPGQGGSTASPRPKAASTSRTGICGFSSGATGSATAPGVKRLRKHLRKTVESCPAAS
ncbi:methyltransferase family protein [Streptomyces sp. Ag109_O5-1]|uniref:class I SAM-dependent methyltransferase n=1 Tax=Streptomyces sp. Ag109_O5-1 TaxID=1938851 RepID=UPI000F4F2D06|nr:class I SAM-dependent methyltransferase [Streptomyces sp. Ag109_O5-1]RPE42971.1 methyltransferase family protein [Streptomyces sp. Ag109_O5-1]